VDPKAAQAIDHILARAKAHGVVAGIHNGRPEAALKRASPRASSSSPSAPTRADRRRAQQASSQDARGGQPAQARLLLNSRRNHMKIGFIGLGIMGAPMAAPDRAGTSCSSTPAATLPPDIAAKARPAPSAASARKAG
jgi:hypothetical protein